MVDFFLTIEKPPVARCMLLNRALAANADTLENVDTTDLGGSMFLRLLGSSIGGETP
jgi:hypothetical protein